MLLEGQRSTLPFEGSVEIRANRRERLRDCAPEDASRRS